MYVLDRPMHSHIGQRSVLCVHVLMQVLMHSSFGPYLNLSTPAAHIERSSEEGEQVKCLCVHE